MDTFGVGSQLREATSSLFAVQYIWLERPHSILNGVIQQSMAMGIGSKHWRI